MELVTIRSFCNFFTNEEKKVLSSKRIKVELSRTPFWLDILAICRETLNFALHQAGSMQFQAGKWRVLGQKTAISHPNIDELLLEVRENCNNLLEGNPR